MKIILILGIVVCAYAADVQEPNTEKRQSQEGVIPTRLIYRIPRKQDQGAPVEEPQQEENAEAVGHTNPNVYRPGQVFSLNAQELLELQPERKAPLTSNQLLQQLYPDPQLEHKQNLQQFYYLDPQISRQVSLQPSHAVIARPTHSSDGGEASVGAALSVSDTGASSTNSFDHELLALLGQAPIRQEDHSKQSFEQHESNQQQQQSSTVQSAAPQYQQFERYVTKPSKKPTKLRSKVQILPPHTPAAPQQYLIETTNVQQQQSQQPHPQPQAQPQYRPTPQPQRFAQALRYVPFQQSQQLQQPLHERPESQGLTVVEAPKLQQVQEPRAQLDFGFIPQYLSEAAPKQYRLIDVSKPQQIKQEQRVQSSNVERPVDYLKRYPETEKLRSIKIYDPVLSDGLQSQIAQSGGDQYLLRPVYRTNDPRGRYEVPSLPAKPESQHGSEATKPHSTIYVNKNLTPRKVSRPQLSLREHNANVEEPAHEHPFRIGQPSNVDQVNIEQHGQSIDQQRSHLPPPKNNRAYTPEEFAGLVAAGYAVTPVPVSALNLEIAQSRSDTDSFQQPLPVQSKHRPANRRPLYLPLRGDDAP